jgi:hypothetical protein
VALVLRYRLRRKRDLILAAFREEYEEWREGPDGSLSLALSDDCPAIVRHVAGIALMHSRTVLEKHIMPDAGYRVARDGPWAAAWVPPARAACWGGTGGPGSRDLGGPFVRAGAGAERPDDVAVGWQELPAPPAPAAAAGDVVARHAWLTGLCACDVCTGTRRTADVGAGTPGVGEPSRRASREPALRRARDRLADVDGQRLSAVLADLQAWEWTLPWPGSLDALRAALEPGPHAVEVAGMLALVARDRRDAAPPNSGPTAIR